MKQRKVKTADINKYMDIIEARAREHKTGARWALRLHRAQKRSHQRRSRHRRHRRYFEKSKRKQARAYLERASLADLENWQPSTIKVEEFMSTDLFTVQKEDLIELVAEIMDWRKIRYMPVRNY